MMAERCARTLKTTMYLQLIGYSVIEEYEGRWNNIKKSNTEAQRTKHLWHQTAEFISMKIVLLKEYR